MNYMLGQDALSAGMTREDDIRATLDTLYNKSLDTSLGFFERRRIDRQIKDLEGELDLILGTTVQATTPGGYLTPAGVKPSTGLIIGDPALVLGGTTSKQSKKPMPWILLALAAGTAAYFMMKG